MSNNTTIALIGDHNPSVAAHVAIPQALQIAGENAGRTIEHSWVATDSFDGDIGKALSAFDGIWCTPCPDPYASMDGALGAIRFAREHDIPFLGTCAGFQHAVLEYTRNVLGYANADSAEANPEAEMPVIAPLACSLAGKRGEISFRPGSRLAGIYGDLKTEELYQCNYGFNPHYAALLEGHKLGITGGDIDGEPRAVELEDHPFFVATLFQPERSALTGAQHPLISAFVEAACFRG